MKRPHSLNLILIGLMAATFAIGCKQTPTRVTPVPGARTGVGGKNTEIGLNSARPPTTGGPVTPGFGTTLQPIAPIQPLPPPLEPLPPIQPLPPAGTPLPLPTNLEMINGMAADRNAFQANTVLFDFDKSVVRRSEVAKIQDVARALKASPHNKVQIEGHCDERGTEEYNRSLAERRALAIREVLVHAGITPDRVFTISYGEDRPLALGHDDASWSKNRRGQLVLLLPQ